MGKFREKISQRRGGSRKVNTIKLRTRILIVCEGMKTEPNYFKSFRVRADVEIVIEGGAGNTLSVVERATVLSKKSDYDSIWCVFDRDSFPNGNFTNAIAAAESRNYKVAYSNEAFEIWYLLHFDYHVTAHSRKEYSSLLSDRLGKEYRKNDSQIYDILKDKQNVAVRNADKLCKEYTIHNPDEDNPYTTVYLLVQELNENLVE